MDQQRIEHYFDIKSTQLDMVRDRGYLVSEYEENIVDDINSFEKYFSDTEIDDSFWNKRGLDPTYLGNFNFEGLWASYNKIRQGTGLSWQVYWNFERTRLLLVYYVFNNKTIPVDFIKDFFEFTNVLRNIKTRDQNVEMSIVMISNVELTSDSKKNFKNIPRSQFFLEGDLSYNPIQHIYNQQHILLTASELIELLSELKIGKSQLPGMKVELPVAKYYGWLPGDVVRIYRTERYVNTLASKSVNYRVINV